MDIVHDCSSPRCDCGVRRAPQPEGQQDVSPRCRRAGVRWLGRARTSPRWRLRPARSEPRQPSWRTLGFCSPSPLVVSEVNRAPSRCLARPSRVRMTRQAAVTTWLRAVGGHVVATRTGRVGTRLQGEGASRKNERATSRWARRSACSDRVLPPVNPQMTMIEARPSMTEPRA